MKPDLKIFLRKVNFSDIEFLWYLRNQPDVYKYFKNSRKVSWEKHIKWILPIILNISNREIFIIQNSKVQIGQVRFNYETLDISISILKEFRGKGITTKVLSLAIKEIKKQKKVKYILAEIYERNLLSIKLFEKSDFKFKTKKGNWLRYILRL